MKKALRILLFAVVGLLVVFALFCSAHLVVIKGQVEREGMEMPIFIPELETTSSLEILPLFEEEVVDEDLDSGHGVSYLIRTDQASIILDLGMNPPDTILPYFLRNFGTLNRIGKRWMRSLSLILTRTMWAAIRRGSMTASLWETSACLYRRSYFTHPSR